MHVKYWSLNPKSKTLNMKMGETHISSTNTIKILTLNFLDNWRLFALFLYIFLFSILFFFILFFIVNAIFIPNFLFLRKCTKKTYKKRMLIQKIIPPYKNKKTNLKLDLDIEVHMSPRFFYHSIFLILIFYLLVITTFCFFLRCFLSWSSYFSSLNYHDHNQESCASILKTNLVF